MDIQERLATLEANTTMALEILHDIKEYMTKTDVQDHRITLIETHCSNCDLNDRMKSVEGVMRAMKLTVGAVWTLTAGWLINWLWEEFKKGTT